MSTALSKLSDRQLDELADGIVDYCLERWGSRDGAIRALAAVGIGSSCTRAIPHRAHLDDGCPGLALDEYVAAGGTLPLRAGAINPDPGGQLAGTAWLSTPAGEPACCPDCRKPGGWTSDDEWDHNDLDDALACDRQGLSHGDEPEGPDYDETAETAEECRRDLLEAGE